MGDLNKLQKRISADFFSLGIISTLISKLTKRNKLLRIADKSRKSRQCGRPQCVSTKRRGVRFGGQKKFTSTHEAGL